MEKIKFFSGIKTRTTIYTIIPVVVSFFLVCSVLFVSLFTSQQNMARAEFQSIVRRHTANFEREINNAVEYLSFVASILEFRVNEGMPDREALQLMLYHIFDRHTVDSSSIYFEPNRYDGKDAEYIDTTYGTALSGRICFYFYRTSEGTGYLPEAMENEVEFTLPIYVEAREQNAPIITDPAWYEIDGVNTLMFAIVYPIRDRNNRFIGAVTADIHLGDIFAELQAEEIYETGYIVIKNYREQIIYSPRFGDIGKTREEAGFTYSLPSVTEESIVFNARSILNYDRSLIAINTIYVQQLGNRFYISVAAPVREINARGTQLLITVITLSVIVLALIALLLYYLIGKMMKPLEEFKESAEKIARGDYSTRIKGSYKDEFAVLKNTVNLMAERIEDHMEESSATLHVLQNILDGIDAYIYVSIPKTGEILFMNDQMKKGFNIKSEVIGQYCYKVLQDGFDEMCVFCPCRKLDEDPDTPVVWEEFNILTKRYYHNTDCYIDWVGGAKVHLQHSVDITDIKTITAEKAKAEETSRTKSVFLASMSHEIRTPMHGIIGFSELALDDDIAPKTRNYLSKIKTSAESLLLIINDILDVSKIEAGKMELEMIPFDISEVFKLCRMISSPKAREKGLTLFCYAEPSVGRLLVGDPTRLQQILLNLLSNAIKFTNNGMVKLLAAIVGATENSTTIHFEVKDSGIGMTPEQIKKIFQPFMQADDSTTRKYGGTGLGLTISKNFIELMGGKLHVDSAPGLGSKFSFDLTFQTVVKDNKHPQIAATVIAGEKPIFDGEVLVCEDNPLNQTVITDHLAKVGLKTVIAGNGRIGIELVRSRTESGAPPFDLIFMDIHMPEIDGLEAAKTLIEMGCSTPIVALTANIMTTDKETYFEAGMCDCLSKPFVAQDLWACLVKFLKPISIAIIQQDDDNTDEEEQRMELIVTFLKSNQTTLQDIKDALEVGNVKLAHRLAHTLKSVAGIVGMTALTEAAQTLEHSLYMGKVQFLNEQISELENELNAAFAELKPIADNHMNKVKRAVDSSFDKEKALKLLETLDSFLKTDSFESLNFVAELAAIPGTEQLADLVENFKFKPAREMLAVIKQKVDAWNEQ
jgi:signal transduction histidine kinase/CheY-like chemotaxis protein